MHWKQPPGVLSRPCRTHWVVGLVTHGSAFGTHCVPVLLHVVFAGHVPQAIVPLQPLSSLPQTCPCVHVVLGTQTHTSLALQEKPGWQVPQLTDPPQLLGTLPQSWPAG